MHQRCRSGSHGTKIVEKAQNAIPHCKLPVSLHVIGWQLGLTGRYSLPPGMYLAWAAPRHMPSGDDGLHQLVLAGLGMDADSGLQLQ